MSREFIDVSRRVLLSGAHYLTSGYGERIINGKTSFHYGCDIVGGDDTTSKTDFITAFEHGIVTRAVNNITGNIPSEGNNVCIRHGNGYFTYYFHLKTGTLTVSEGDVVRRGDVIGFMGNTGNSYGAHLHFAVKHNGFWRDPMPFLYGDSVMNSPDDIVATMQLLLNQYAAKSESGIEIIDTDGSFGARTQRALTKYQEKHELTADGICSAAVWEHLMRV